MITLSNINKFNHGNNEDKQQENDDAISKSGIFSNLWNYEINNSKKIIIKNISSESFFETLQILFREYRVLF